MHRTDDSRFCKRHGFVIARTQADNVRSNFGTGKIGLIGGFTSAVVLAIVAFLPEDDA
jgi:Co/Zn/Cd efflux system component